MKRANDGDNAAVDSAQKGQGLVEFALVVLFIFMPLCILILDGTHILSTYHRLQHATREGAKIVTETAIPIPNPNAEGLPAACTSGTCSSTDDSLCCIAVSRTYSVLFKSAITDASIEGTWSTVNRNGKDYVFLTIEATRVVRYFFQAGTLALTTVSTGYADEFEPET